MLSTYPVIHRYIDDPIRTSDLTSFNQSSRIAAARFIPSSVTTTIDPDKDRCAGGVVCRVGSTVEYRLWNDHVKKQAVLGGPRV